jgi:hypothetical protein
VGSYAGNFFCKVFQPSHISERERKIPQIAVSCNRNAIHEKEEEEEDSFMTDANAAAAED